MIRTPKIPAVTPMPPTTVQKSRASWKSACGGALALILAAPVTVAIADLDGTPDNIDTLLSNYQSQGLKINRLTAWQNKSGKLLVGNDKSNFDALTPDDISEPSLFDEAESTEPVTTQIAWTGSNGFSIALEETAEPNADDAQPAEVDALKVTDGTPKLILSWRGEFAEQGSYQVSAIGRKLELKGVHDGVEVDDDALGWGLQLAGGWRFGDLFAALRVTVGNGIDSLILNRFGGDVAVSNTGEAETLESLTILPSLKYSLDETSDIHLSVGRYESIDNEVGVGIDTLDTINLGYSLSPWPNTRFGVEVTDKNFEGATNDEDSTEIKIGAQQEF